MKEYIVQNSALCIPDSNLLEIKVKYHKTDMMPLEFIGGEKSNWIDLRSAETQFSMKAFEHKMISLGVSMQLPQGYEAIIIPRSSTLKHFGIIQGNSIGLIDNSYSGNDDIWHFSALAIRDTEINFLDRICQFRIQLIMSNTCIKTVAFLDNNNRGGLGSTGVR